MNHRFWFWWSAIFGPICLAWAIWLATGMHWLIAGISGGASLAHAGAAKLHHSRMPAKIPPPSRHDLALREIDRLERELRIGAYVKTQAEFDREVEAAVRPFRLFLTDLTTALLMHLATRSRRRIRYRTSYGLPGTRTSGRSHLGGPASAVQSIGQAHARLIRAMMGDDSERR